MPSAEVKMRLKRSILARRKNIQKANECKRQYLIDRRSSAVSAAGAVNAGNSEAEQVPRRSPAPPPDGPTPDWATASLPKDEHEQVHTGGRGRRVMSVDGILTGIDALCVHSKDCHPPTFTSEVSTGLVTSLKYLCHLCGAVFLVGGTKEESDLNHQAAHAAVTTGSDYSAQISCWGMTGATKEQMACVEVPFIGFSTFLKHEIDVTEVRP